MLGSSPVHCCSSELENGGISKLPKSPDGRHTPPLAKVPIMGDRGRWTDQLGGGGRITIIIIVTIIIIIVSIIIIVNIVIIVIIIIIVTGS